MNVLLTNEEIRNYLNADFKLWKLSDNSIQRDFTFSSFGEAFSFMTMIALEAEKTDHHPDWCNVYKKVSITLTTHSLKGLTQADFDMAGKIEKIYGKYA